MKKPPRGFYNAGYTCGYCAEPCSNPSCEFSTGKAKIAICVYCGRKKVSNPNLPFYKERLDRYVDEFYCGCKGWD